MVMMVLQCPVVSAIEYEDVLIHGFVSQGYLKSTDNNYLAETEDGTFEFNEAGINFSYLLDKLRIGLQLYSKDLGDEGNNDIFLDWALADYRYRDFLGFRAGKIKAPLGLYNKTRDVDMLRTPILMPASIYSEVGRDFTTAYNGFSIYGTVDLPVASEIDYEVFGGTFNVDDNSRLVKGNIEQTEMFLSHDLDMELTAENRSFDSQHSFGGALRWSAPIEGLRFGFSYMMQDSDLNFRLRNQEGRNIGEYNSEVDINYQTTYSVEYTWKDLTLSAEWQTTKITNDFSIQPSSSDVGGISGKEKTKSEGWYIQANYVLSDTWTFGLYYSVFYTDRGDRGGENFKRIGKPDHYAWQKEIVPSIRYDITSNFLIKAEAHIVDGTAQVYEFDNPQGKDGNWEMLALKASFSF
jgi:hypothetical protein